LYNIYIYYTKKTTITYNMEELKNERKSKVYQLPLPTTTIEIGGVKRTIVNTNILWNINFQHFHDIGQGAMIETWESAYQLLFFSPSIPNIVKETLSDENMKKLITARTSTIRDVFQDVHGMDPALNTIYSYMD